MSTTAPDNRFTTYTPVVPTTVFEAQFPIFANGDISVFIDGVEREDFTVTASYVEGVSNDAKVIMNSGVTGNVVIVGDRDPRRQNRFGFGPIAPRDLNLAFDTVEGEVQEARRDIDRSVRSEIGEPGYIIDPGLVDGDTPMKQGDRLVPGPNLPSLASSLIAEATAQANRSHDEADRSEAARDVAAGYASDAVSQGNVPIYATKAGMSAFTLPAGLVQFQLRGRSVAGDSPLTTWNVVGAVEPNVAPALKGQDAAGVWFVINESRPKIDMFAAWTPQAKLDFINARMTRGDTLSIACFGDSTTDGVNTAGWTQNPVDGSGDAVGGIDHEATAPNAWPAKLKALLRQMCANSNINVWNAGYTGKKLSDGWAYRNYEKAVISNPQYGMPDVVLIAFGLNDVVDAGFLANHVSETRKLCLKVMSYGAIPILLTSDAVGWTVNRDNRMVSRQIDASKRAIAAELSIPIIEIGAAMDRWLSRNRDGYRWWTLQGDRLHIDDKGHAFKASYIARILFNDVAFIPEGQSRRVPILSSASGAVLPNAGVFATPNNLQGAIPTFSSANVPVGQAVIDMYVWNEEPEAELVYRAVDHDNYTDAGLANAPKISVTELISGVETRKSHAMMGFNRGSSPYYRSDQPFRFGKLPYGLSRVRYIAGAVASNGLWPGNFEIWKTSRSKLTNALRESGPIFKEFSVSPPTQLFLLPEAEDGSNVYGLFEGDVVTICAELTLPSGAGLVIAHTAGYGSGGFGTRNFMFLYRSATFLTIYPGIVTDGGVITLGTGSVLAQGSFTPGTNDLALKVKIWREADNQRVQVFNGISGGTLVIDATIPRASYPVSFAGAVGGLIWNNTSVSGNAALRTLTVERS